MEDPRGGVGKLGGGVGGPGGVWGQLGGGLGDPGRGFRDPGGRLGDLEKGWETLKEGLYRPRRKGRCPG